LQNHFGFDILYLLFYEYRLAKNEYCLDLLEIESLNSLLFKYTIMNLLKKGKKLGNVKRKSNNTRG
jgi:hypothetical protein